MIVPLTGGHAKQMLPGDLHQESAYVSNLLCRVAGVVKSLLWCLGGRVVQQEPLMSEEKADLGTWVSAETVIVVWQVHGSHPLPPAAAACLLGCAAAVAVGACH